MSNHFPCSVVLAAHGSTADETANASLFELASLIEQQGLFSRVTPAFLNGEPNITNVFCNLPAGDVVIVPVMTSDGYYLNQVVPGKIGENPNLELYRIFMTPPLGIHPDIPALATDRIESLMELLPMTHDDTSVIVVGHGTKRNPQSEVATRTLVSRMQELLPESDIRPAFIDQDPSISQVIGEITRAHMLVIPFLIARGPHVTEDVPAAFGLPTGSDISFPLIDVAGGGLIVCDLPIGMYPEVSELCIELATDQLMSGKPVDPATFFGNKNGSTCQE